MSNGIPIALLQAVAELAPVPAVPQRTQPQVTIGPVRSWSVAEVLDRNGIGFTETQATYGTVYKLDRCLTSTDHTDGAAITELPSGALAYRCHHNRCSTCSWSDAREALGLSGREQSRDP
jgi:hypothetical protein